MISVSAIRRKLGPALINLGWVLIDWGTSLSERGCDHDFSPAWPLALHEKCAHCTAMREIELEEV